MACIELTDRSLLARKVLAGCASGLIVFTYVVCVAYTVSAGTYIGGLSFPYFSDTGREGTTYYIFASLNSIASILLMAFMVLQYAYIRAWSEVGNCCTSITSCAFGFIAPIFAIALSVVSTNMNAAIHTYSAYVFFGGMTIHVIGSYVIYYRFYSVYPAHQRLFWPRTVTLVVFIIGVLCYLLIGLAILCDFKRLTMDECINEEELGIEYCTDLVNPDNATLTVLFSYSDCVAENHLRTAGQFISLVSIMAYAGLYCLDPPLDGSEAQGAGEGIPQAKKKADSVSRV